MRPTKYVRPKTWLHLGSHVLTRCLQSMRCDILVSQSVWKRIHGDVFRFPDHLALFCAGVGTGNQLIALTICHFAFALLGLTSLTRRGSTIAAIIVLYCLASVVNGYSTVRLFRQLNGKNWVNCLLVTAALLPTPVIAVFLYVNSIALQHGSTSAFEGTTVLTCLALLIFLSLPLTGIGGMIARHYAAADFDAPTRTADTALEIPENIPWYLTRLLVPVAAGLLPFGAIYIELQYLYATMWGHQSHSMFGILFLSFILLVAVATSVTISLLCFQLSRGDHQWWWAAFINGGMTGLYVFAYSFYYYFQRSGMSGQLQASVYFGYMAVVSFAVFLMLGSASFQFSLVFVRCMYSQIKSD
jgi:Endomembrane protein 70